MIMRRTDVDLQGKKLETADAVPGKKIEIPVGNGKIHEPGITVVISGEAVNKIDNICIYFREDTKK